MSTQEPPRAFVGGIVHFILQDGPNAGKHRPAIILEIDDEEAGLVELQVFTNGEKDRPDMGFPAYLLISGSGYSEGHEAGTWHWPEHP